MPGASGRRPVTDLLAGDQSRYCLAFNLNVTLNPGPILETTYKSSVCSLSPRRSHSGTPPSGCSGKKKRGNFRVKVANLQSGGYGGW